MRILFVTFLVLAVAQSATAFDGRRKGLVLGVGVGASGASYTMDVSSAGMDPYSNTDNQAGFGLRGAQIGIGFDERFMLVVDNLIVTTSDVTNYIGGVGFNAYFTDAAPSMYVTGLLGIGTVKPDGLESHSGFGLAAGLGWEFAPHYSTEMVFGWNRAQRDEKPSSGFDIFNQGGPAIDTDMWTVLVSINTLAY
jgi:hypothetical protein